MDWFLYDRNLRHERVNLMMRIGEIAEHGWFNVGCIDCIGLPYPVETVELLLNVGEENLTEESESKWEGDDLSVYVSDSDY